MNSNLASEKINVFMSIPEENPNIEFLRSKLLSLGIIIVDNTSFNVDIEDDDKYEISFIIKKLISITDFIFICISKKTYKSYFQTLELNEIIMKKDFNKEEKIIYLYLEKECNPISQPHHYYGISNNENKICLPLYDYISTSETIEKIINLIV